MAKPPINLWRPIEVSKPLPDAYLAKGWFEGPAGETRTVKHELLNEIAFQKAYALIDQGVGSDTIRALDHHLTRLAFGVPPGAPSAPFSKDDKRVLTESLKDAASSARQLEDWVVNHCMPYVRDRIELQALSSHVQAVAVKLAELEATRQVAEDEQANDAFFQR